LRKRTEGAEPQRQPALQPAAKPPFSVHATSVTSRSATEARLSSLEALSTTMTLSQSIPPSGSTHPLRVPALLYETMTTSTSGETARMAL
jgi:hypothetical protein